MGLIVGQCIYGFGLGGVQKVIVLIVCGGFEDIEYVVYFCEDGVLVEEVCEVGVCIWILLCNVLKWDYGWMWCIVVVFVEDGVDVVYGYLFGDMFYGYFVVCCVFGFFFLMMFYNDYESFSMIQKWGYGYFLRCVDFVVGCLCFVERFFVVYYEVNGWLLLIVNGVEVLFVDDGVVQ